MNYASKYKPHSMKEFVGQKEAIAQFEKWIKTWKPEQKALLFHGPTGIGKTALVEAWTAENKFDLIQINASDYRSATDIKESLGRSVQQQSLFKRGKIFLIDEIDGLAGQEDRGGVGEIIEMIKTSAHPLILIANDPWDSKLRTLRNYCTLIQFKKLPVWDIEKKLSMIAEKEKIEVDKDTLRMLASRAEGDMRAALNDFEVLSNGRKKISVGDFEALGFREREENIFEVLKMIFKTQTALAAKLAVNHSDKDPEEIFWWIENNITNEFEEPEEIAAAFDALSKADIFRQQVQSRQNWTMKSYMIDMMTAGVSMSKKNMYRKFTRYEYPKNIMILGRTKVSRKYKLEILKKLSSDLHCSTKKIRNDYLPFFKIAAKSHKFKKNFLENFGLTKDDIKELFSK
jgi:replication factor C large subunit